MTSGEEILARIQARMLRLGLTENAVGALAGQRSLLRGIRRNLAAGSQSSIRTKSLQRLADALGVSPKWLLTGEDDGQESAGSPTLIPPKDTGAKPPTAPPPAPLTAYARDIPLVGTAHGAIVGDVAGLKMRVGVLRYIRRPPSLAGIPNIYAVEVRGHSMEPMLRPGDICIVNPNLSAVPGDQVIVQTQHYADDPGQAYVKILKARTPTRLILEQINPQATLEIPREYVASVHRVMTVKELFDEED